MTTIRTARFLLKLILVALFSIYALFNYHSVWFFAKSFEFWFKGHGGAAAIADQVVIVKYPYSPLAPISKGLLLIKIGMGEMSEKNLFSKAPPVVDTFLTKNWSPLKVDGFALLCILFYGIAGLTFNILHENRGRKKQAWLHLAKGAGILATFCFCAYVVTSNQIFAGENRMPYVMVALLSIAWAVIGLVLFKKSIGLIRQSNVSVEEYVKESDVLVTHPEMKPAKALAFYYAVAFVVTFFVTADVYDHQVIDTSRISEITSKAIASITSSRPTHFVSINGLNMRSGPGTSHSVLCVLEQKCKVRMIKQNGRWAYVKARDKKGWVSLKYIKKL